MDRTHAPPSARRRSTAIYLWIAVAVTIAGAALMFAGGLKSDRGLAADSWLQSVGTSFLAGGLTLLGLGVLRHYDDKDGEVLDDKVDGLATVLADNDRLLSAIERSVDRLGHEIERQVHDSIEASEQIGKLIARSTLDLGRSVRIENSARLRCVSDSEIGGIFQAEFLRRARVDEAHSLEVDVLGLKLFRFLSDQWQYLLESRHPTNVRLLLQDPDSAIFREICELEGRSVQSTLRDVARSIKLLAPGAAIEDDSLVRREGSVTANVRFFSHYQPVTLFRVDDVAYVRARISTPQGAATRFYEKYERRDGSEHFRVQQAHFESSWAEARYSVPRSVSELLPEVGGASP